MEAKWYEVCGCAAPPSAVGPYHGRELGGTVTRPVAPEAKLVIGSAVYLLVHLGHMVAGVCNDYRSHVDLDTIPWDFSEIRIRIRLPVNRRAKGTLDWSAPLGVDRIKLLF